MPLFPKKNENKLPIWNYFNADANAEVENNNNNNNTTITEHNTEIEQQSKFNAVHLSKKQKRMGRNSLDADITWLRSLLQPSMEFQFSRYKVITVLSCSAETLICELKLLEDKAGNIDVDGNSNSKTSMMVGYFNIWWWKLLLPKMEFITLCEFEEGFPFIRNINAGCNLLQSISEAPSLLLHNPKTIADCNVPERTLITSKRFLII